MPREGKASITVDKDTQEMLQRNKPDGVTWDRFLSRLLYATDDGDGLPTVAPRECPECGGHVDACRLHFDGCGVAMCPHCDERIAKGSPLSLPAGMGVVDLSGGVVESADMAAGDIIDAVEARIGPGGSN